MLLNFERHGGRVAVQRNEETSKIPVALIYKNQILCNSKVDGDARASAGVIDEAGLLNSQVNGRIRSKLKLSPLSVTSTLFNGWRYGQAVYLTWIVKLNKRRSVPGKTERPNLI